MSSNLRLQLAAELAHSDLLDVERAMREASAQCRQRSDGSGGWLWRLPDWRTKVGPRIARLFPPLSKSTVEVHGTDRGFILRYFRDELLRAADVCLEARLTLVASDLIPASPDALRKFAHLIIGRVPAPISDRQAPSPAPPLVVPVETVDRIVSILQRIVREAALRTDPKAEQPKSKKAAKSNLRQERLSLETQTSQATSEMPVVAADVRASNAEARRGNAKTRANQEKNTRKVEDQIKLGEQVEDYLQQLSELTDKLPQVRSETGLWDKFEKQYSILGEIKRERQHLPKAAQSDLLTWLRIANARAKLGLISELLTGRPSVDELETSRTHFRKKSKAARRLNR